MADVLSRACPLCLGVYLGNEMLEFSIEEKATKSRRTIQICGTCAGNIADAVYNHLTAAEQEAKSDAATASDRPGSAASAAPGPTAIAPVVPENQPGSEGIGEHRVESGAAAGGEGSESPVTESKSPGGLTRNYLAEINREPGPGFIVIPPKEEPTGGDN
jgi:hypothetical protein